MDRSSEIFLFKTGYTIDEIGQRIPFVEARPVYCNITSVTGTEWFSGGQNGLRPEYRVTMFRYDYQGEKAANIGGCMDGCEVRGGIDYSIYRTYFRNNDELELYLERRIGS